MPNFQLTTQNGTLSTGTLKEIFVYTLVVNNTAAAPSGVVATNVGAAFKTAWTATTAFKSWFASPVVWRETTSALIMGPTDGSLGAAAHVAYSPTLAGTGSSSLPSQNAIAVSFAGGAKANGTPYRGRHYLPTPATSVGDTDGLLSSTVTDSIRTFYITWFNNLLAGNLVPVIWSRTTGQFQTISQIRVGNKVDTIRSRRNELPETYSVGTLSRESGERAEGDPDEDLTPYRWRPSGN
jgi:hypothetical protein